MTKSYYRPIAQTDSARPDDARPIAGGWAWFNQVEVLSRDRPSKIISISDADQNAIERISNPRLPIAGLTFDAPSIMGILNVTPDSFSDGGRFENLDAATTQALLMQSQNAKMIDIGGESTRPGAQTVEINQEINRVVPAIGAIRSQSDIPISIDTRKALVAKAAIEAGATLVNDVSGFTYDPQLIDVVAAHDVGVCLMHTQGTPDTMQINPTYSSILLDVYDFLEHQISLAEKKGIKRARILIDPGIGFGKTTDHCIDLISGISLFHSLGCPILLGVSRKSFIGNITAQNSAHDRVIGSVATAIIALLQGVQVFRVHDIQAHADAFRMTNALTHRGQ